MKNIFQTIGLRRPQKSSFNLSHNRKFSFAPGMLYPTLCQEILPGDVWDASTSALVRMMPMPAPVMHMVDVYSYSFFIPARLCMQNSKWEVFITGGENGDGKDAQGNTIEIPYAQFGKAGLGGVYINYGVFNEGGLGDYLGISYSGHDEVGLGDRKVKINMMPFLAFWRTWCEYFRDQNLMPDFVSLYPAIFQATGDISAAVIAAQTDPDNPFPFFDIPQVCWEKDMYTSALPFAQRGQPVETPLSGTAQVTYKDVAVTTEVPFVAGDMTVNATGDVQIPGSPGAKTTGIDNIESVELTSGGFTINALRLAARLQEWLEKMARGGARYVEQTLSQWGVVSSDARLQRAEYLAGGKIPVAISEVLQTSENAETPLAEMAGHGVAAGNVTHFKKFFEEHGYVLTVFFMRPRTAYQQGTPRMFTNRFDKLDWPWPSFAHLGEQEVQVGELFLNFAEEDLNTFGYQQRYAECKYIPNTVHGDFKETLNFWHWGRIFVNRPALNADFVGCDPSPRIFNVLQVNDFDPLYAIVNHKITAVRPLPYYGEPTL